jgi:signal transduction histidine kinase
VTDGHAPQDATALPAPDAGSAVASPYRDAALWAETLQQIATLVAHDLRNALNAVAVNLEVARGRSARGAEAAAIAPFAATAASHFDIAAAATEALLAFARPEPGQVDIAAVVARLTRLLAVRSHASLRITDRSGGRAITNAPGDIARVAVARSVLAALGTGEEIACEITADDGIFLRLIGAARVPPLPDSYVVIAAAASGIHFAPRGQSLELRFP